jgi:hypothetical protein
MHHRATGHDLSDTPAPLDAQVRGLVSIARTRAGLEVLLLLAQDPLVCDSSVGFAQRLHRPQDDVREALEALQAHGVLESSAGPAGSGSTSYWLPSDPDLFATLGRLWLAYATIPAQRLVVLSLVGPSDAANGWPSLENSPA